VDIRIGVTYSPREIELQLADDVDRDELKGRVDTVLGSSDGVLWVTDRKGREVGVPAGKIAYVELGSATEARPMGFSS
jgi:hypothetical protein